MTVNGNGSHLKNSLRYLKNGTSGNKKESNPHSLNVIIEDRNEPAAVSNYLKENEVVYSNENNGLSVVVDDKNKHNLI